MVDLSTTYAGLKLRSPLIAAAAGITGTLERLKKAEDNGIGAVVTKSLFQKEICRISPTPRFKIVKHASSTTLYSYEQASEYGLYEYAEFIHRAKSELVVPVIASINCYTDDAWVEYGKLMEQAGADAIELNLSCPHGVHIMSGIDVIESMVATTKLMKNAVKIPVIPKMTPQSTNPASDALRLDEAGADGLVMFNRFTGLDIDVEKEVPILHGGYAGHGGPWSIMFSLRWISAVSPRVKCDISGSGGVMNGDDAVKYVLAGAKTVQICTAIILNGYEIIGRINREIEKFMESKGYTSIEDFKGKICNKIKSMDEVDRTQWAKAVIDQNRCTTCGLCARVCIYDGIGINGDKYFINNKCDGCGLCAEVCPVKAISMVRR
ncbi:dihydroorotate dehydrogenase (fumarate) [Caldanaerobius fijiensis DSM 17918]|uniref:dihydrouracil dehydrogenase (NAD(+)) n=1 Tax=Caldanaerobius fijiensis DSM 17918 TaxID=1121256 RepID=A0A1M5CR99_9THEO|nr:4Fe-4S binding protein [Caldanaerobius fijiensis]SHF57300.1 dihydroorotate dehydrogenase (fumarate) [Caldanaerobius fijiensis DSM 17918]